METVRKIDELGRIVLPADMRYALRWEAEAQISISRQDNRLILKAYNDSCFACGNAVNILPIHNKFICQKCIDEITIKK